jgi:RNA polymerase sigma-70 factor (ECF subfamily)
MDEQADEIGLIEQSLRGDQLAFSALMARYTGAVYNLAYRMLGDAQDAEDASQEIFLRAYTHLASFDRARKFSTWLLSIGSNHCIDRLRRQRMAWMTLDDVAYAVPSEARGPEEQAEASETRDAVQRALLRIPEHYRQVLVLRYWNDFSYDEIGQATGLTEATIKTRLHRARHMLAEALAAEGITSAAADSPASNGHEATRAKSSRR